MRGDAAREQRARQLLARREVQVGEQDEVGAQARELGADAAPSP